MRVTRGVVLCAGLLCVVGIGARPGIAQMASARVREGADGAQRQGQDSALVSQPGPLAAGRITIELDDVELKEALRAIAREGKVVLLYNDRDIPVGRRVSASVSGGTVGQALEVVLRGTELRARATAAGIVVERSEVPQPRTEPRDEQGGIHGRVTDGETHEPLAGVTLRLEGTSFSAVSGSDGGYRIANVPAGSYTLTARRVGYEEASRAVVVSEAEVTADLSLTAATTVLDEVVTTGTIVPTEVKALPTPVSLISASDIAAQRPHSMQEIFRQAVPGAVSWVYPQNPYQTAFSARGASTLSPGGGQMKVFIDGIAVVNPSDAAVDPQSIERIEVVRGPQAATIYGSDAIGGVIQVFTKRGGQQADRPQIDGEGAFSLIQTPYRGFDRVPRQHYAVEVRGGRPEVGYGLGATFGHIGNYLPNGEESAQSRTNIFGSIRAVHGIVALDLSGRYQTQDAPTVFNPSLTETGYVAWSKPYHLPTEVQNETIGARLSVSPTVWWQHTLTVGIDRFAVDLAQSQPRQTSPADTFLILSNSAQRKASIGYTTTVQRPLGSSLSGSLTAGFEHYSLPTTSYVGATALNTSGAIKTAPGTSMSVTRTTTTNTGYFLQAQLGLKNALFLTAGMRGERNNQFGDSIGTPISPRIGLSYVHEAGQLTLKLRSSYGRAIRPPAPGEKLAAVGTVVILANPRLGPERQEGGDVGVDAVFGSHGSLSVTYYDQTADDLIQEVLVESSPKPTFKWDNVGRVKNTGIEIEAAASIWPLTLKGQFAYTRSRIVRLAPNYQGELRVGDQAEATPKYGAGGALSMSLSKHTSITAGVTHVSSWRYLDYLAYYACLGSTAPCRNATFAFNRDYLATYPGFTKLNATISHDFSSGISVFASVDNLTNDQSYEIYNGNPVMGRITTVGLRFRY